MPKIDPFAQKRPKSVTETKSFTDPAQPGVTLTVTLTTKPGYATDLKMQATGRYLVERYIDDPEAIGVFLDGEELPVTKELCFVIASIKELESGADTDRYSFEEWLTISYTMPDAFGDVVEWAGTLTGPPKPNSDGSPKLPNGSAAGSESTLEPPQSTN